MFKPKTKVKNPNDASRAYDYAVYLLGLHLRTTGEMQKKLQEKGYAEAVIAETVNELISQHYLDDQQYAEVFLENLKTYKNFGYYGIKKKFMEKKLPPEIIESVLAEGLSVEDELKIAKRLLKKEGVAVKEASAAEIDNVYNTYNETESKQKQKNAQKLKSRGFRGEVLSKIIFR